MLARLVSSNGYPDIPLDSVLVVVGRHHQCTVRIDSIRVSRHHCLLALSHDGVLVRDLGSTNGTWINGRRIEDEQVLRLGDELTIAHCRYHLQIHQTDERISSLVSRWLHGRVTLPLSDIDPAAQPAAPPPEMIPPDPPPPDVTPRQCDADPG